MYLQIGNGGIDWIEKKLEIKFSEKDKEILESTHSENATFDEPDKWHAFDASGGILFGSYKALCQFRKMISYYHPTGYLSATFKTYDYDNYIKKEKLTTDGFPTYLIKQVCYNFDGKGIQSSYINRSFLKLAKINKRTLVYKSVSKINYYKDIVKEKSFMIEDIIIPNFEQQVDKKYNDVTDLKILKEELQCDYVTVGVEDFSNDFIVNKIWDGSAVYDRIEKSPWSDEKFSNEAKNHEQQLKELLNK